MTNTRTRGTTAAAALLVSAIFLAAPGTALADQTGEEAGFGAGSALASLLYSPAKLLYAVGGGVVGGLAWAFSAGDNDVALRVIKPAIKGDYVVTPAHLRGERKLEFIGRMEDDVYTGQPLYGADPGYPEQTSSVSSFQ